MQGSQVPLAATIWIISEEHSSCACPKWQTTDPSGSYPSYWSLERASHWTVAQDTFFLDLGLFGSSELCAASAYSTSPCWFYLTINSVTYSHLWNYLVFAFVHCPKTFFVLLLVSTLHILCCCAHPREIVVRPIASVCSSEWERCQAAFLPSDRISLFGTLMACVESRFGLGAALDSCGLGFVWHLAPAFA